MSTESADKCRIVAGWGEKAVGCCMPSRAQGKNTFRLVLAHPPCCLQNCNMFHLISRSAFFCQSFCGNAWAFIF